MFIDSLCGPSIVYIGFSILQIIIDIYKNLYGEAFIKFIIMIILAIVLNILCNMGLSIISWLIVFVPIIMMTFISTLLVQVFNNKNQIKNINLKKAKIKKDKLKNDIIKDKYIRKDNLYNNKVNKNNDEYLFIEKNKKRVNRDIERNYLYDSIDYYYDLSDDEENIDENYSIYNALINWFGVKYFNNNLNKYR
jgi:hypothetical protein